MNPISVFVRLPIHEKTRPILRRVNNMTLKVLNKKYTALLELNGNFSNLGTVF